MRYAAPLVPSPEEEIMVQAAHELFTCGKVEYFYIAVDTVIRGVRECDVLTARLAELGIPSAALIIEPSADTTDGELEAFKRYVERQPSVSHSLLAIEAKRGRVEMIQAQLGFHSLMYWAEDALAGSERAELRLLCTAWRASVRHRVLRWRLGILPRILMSIDPHARLARWLARTFRHQQ